MSSFWNLYRKTYFKSIFELDLAGCFAIITAENPRGDILAKPQNQQLNNRLLRVFQQQNYRYQAITASNKDFSFYEASFVVHCSLEQALDMAVNFEQNAIFWVSDGQVTLIPCLLGDVKQTAMGSLSERLSFCR